MASESSGKMVLLNQLADEFAARYRRGERPSLQEYIDRHPDLADDIREMFPALVEVEQVKEARLGPVEHASPLAPPLEQLGDFRILREIGRGGMGVVYEVEQMSLGRRVALKVLSHKMRDERARRRFQREAKAAGKLHHTNIVPVFGVGEYDGTPYYVMQLIQGQALNDVLQEIKRLRSGAAPEAVGEVARSLLSGHFRATPDDSEPRSPALQGDLTVPETQGADVGSESPAVVASSSSGKLPGQDAAKPSTYWQSVARIGVQVAEALDHAHRQHVLHRDIKPSNRLLDTRGIVWVTDFGLAKADDQENLTATGDVLGTLRYMPPEAFEGKTDSRSDLYSLGLTLYELLVLQPAFDEKDHHKLVKQVTLGEQTPLRQVNAEVPRDLETIVLKAIAREPQRRYQTAEEMAHDLQRFLEDEPIKARRTSVPERLLRWCRRHPAVASLSAVVAALVLTVAVVASVAALLLSAALNESEHHRNETELQRKEAEKNLWEAYLAEAHAGRMSRRVGQRFDSLEAIKKALALPLPPGHTRDELRNEAIACLVLPDLRPVRNLNRCTWPGTEVVHTNIDGLQERFALVDRLGNVSVRRLADNEELYRLPGFGFRSEVNVSISRDGTLVWVFAWPKGVVKLWNLDGPQAVLLAEKQGSPVCVDLKGDGRHVACGMDGRITLIDRATGQARLLPHQIPGLRLLALHPDGSQLAVGRTESGRHLLSVYPLDKTEATATLELPTGIDHVAWHPHGRRLGASGKDSRIYLWEVGQPKPLVLEGSGNSAIFLDFGSQGDLLVSIGWEFVLRFWDPHTGQQLLHLPNTGGYQLNPDGHTLVVERSPQDRQVMEFVHREYRTLVSDPLKGKENYRTPVVSSDGRLLAVGLTDGVGLWDLATGDQVAHLDGLGEMNAPSFDAAGRLVTFSSAGLLRWPVRPGAAGVLGVGPPETLAAVGTRGHAMTSRDGGVIALSGYQKGPFVWRQGPPSRFVQLGAQTDVRRLVLTPDGRWVVAATYNSHQPEGVKLWEVSSGQLVKTLSDENGSRSTVSADGQWLAVNDRKGCHLWEVATWTERRTFSGWGMAFTDDGEMLAVNEGQTIKLVHPASGREYARWEGPDQDTIKHATFTPDGGQLITTGWDTHPIRVWDLRLIRQGLKELNLDWDAPKFSAAPSVDHPLRVKVDYGATLPKLLAGRLVRQSQEHLADKEPRGALKALREAVRIDPTHAEANNSLAWLLLTGPAELRAPKEALPLAQRALELAPEQATYHNTLGVALYRNKQFAAAVKELENSLEASRGEADAYDLFFLAMCHHCLGDTVKAKDCRNRAELWFKEHRAKLPPDQVAELSDFQTEADAVLKQTPDPQPPP